MIRHVGLDEISDGKLYGLNDLVRADCGDCEGCFACCRGMGNSIVLDPLDVHRLQWNLRLTFEELLRERIELTVIDGIILPSLRMTGPEESCSFLTGEGRCGIHAFRPGICRLFPLGRYYENGSFSYFLQDHECRKEKRAKVKVRKWLDTPEVKRYEAYVSDWHYFLKDLEEILRGEPDRAREISMDVLRRFYLSAFEAGPDFYVQFGGRLLAARERWGNGRR